MEFFKFIQRQIKQLYLTFKPEEEICDYIRRIGKEGNIHKETKSFIKQFLNNKNYKTIEECKVFKHPTFDSRIADIYAEKNNEYFYDVEIQCSDISFNDFLDRYIYWRTFEANDIMCVKPIWFFDSKLANSSDMHYIKKLNFNGLYYFSYINGEYSFFKINDLEEVKLSDIFK